MPVYIFVCLRMCMILLVKFTRGILCLLNVVLRSWGHYLYNLYKFLFGPYISYKMSACNGICSTFMVYWICCYSIVSTETHTNDSVYILL